MKPYQEPFLYLKGLGHSFEFVIKNKNNNNNKLLVYYAG